MGTLADLLGGKTHNNYLGVVLEPTLQPLFALQLIIQVNACRYYPRPPFGLQGTSRATRVRETWHPQQISFALPPRAGARAAHPAGVLLSAKLPRARQTCSASMHWTRLVELPIRALGPGLPAAPPRSAKLHPRRQWQNSWISSMTCREGKLTTKMRLRTRARARVKHLLR